MYSPHALATVIPDVDCMGGNIEAVSSEKHLSNYMYIGNITQKSVVSRITNDFLCRVNMVKSHCKHVPVETIYSLFKLLNKRLSHEKKSHEISFVMD